MTFTTLHAIITLHGWHEAFCQVFVILAGGLKGAGGQRGGIRENELMGSMILFCVPPCNISIMEVFIMQKKRRKPWPENCVWPEPLAEGEGDSWSVEDA